MPTGSSSSEGSVPRAPAAAARPRGGAATLRWVARSARALAETGRALTGSLDPAVVARHIADSVRALLDLDIAVVFQVAGQAGDLTVVAASGDVEAVFAESPRYPAGAGLAGLALRSGRPESTTDLLNDPRVVLPPDMRGRLAAAGYRAVLAVPLVIQDHPVGVLGMGHRQPRVFTPREVAVVQRFADQAAVALRSAQLYRDAERRRAAAQALAGLGQRALAGDDLSALLDDAVALAARTLEVEQARVVELAPDGSALAVRAGIGWDPGWVGTGLPVGPGSLAGYVLQVGEALVVSDLAADTRFAAAPMLREHGVVSGAAVVIQGARQPYGVLDVFSRRPRPFGPDDLQALGVIATLLATAIERERAARAHRESEEKYRGLFESSRDAILFTDAEGRVLDANAAALELYGYSREEFIGLDVRALYADPADRRRFLETIERLGSVHGFTVRSRRKDGTVINTLLTSSIRRSPQGAVLGFQGIIRDITEHTRLEDELRQAQKMEAVGRLAGGIAHDFNNLLTVITGRSQLLLHRLPAGDPARPPLELINATALRAASLTRQLLAFSRKQVIQPAVLDLAQVIGDLSAMLRRLIGEDIDLETRACAELAPVLADAAQIEQVVLNLAVNARDAMPTGGRLTIELANVEVDAAFAGRHPGSAAGPRVRLAVADTGVGMDEVTRSRIFEPFFTTKGPGQGTGLGLATVYGIVAQHRGEIEVDTAPGQGTTFRIYLPPVPPATGAGGEAPAEPAAGRGSEAILLVEDDDDLRNLTREILAGGGYTVLDAPTGAAALTRAAGHPGRIDLLLTDVVMPGMSGRQLADALTARDPDLRVLYISGYSDEMLGPRGVLDPGTRLLVKPFAPAVLLASIRRLLDERPPRR